MYKKYTKMITIMKDLFWETCLGLGIKQKYFGLSLQILTDLFHKNVFNIT